VGVGGILLAYFRIPFFRLCSSGRNLHFRIAIFTVPDFAGNHIQFAAKVLVLPLLVYHSPFPIPNRDQTGERQWLA
jgi:hypothetical protein